MKNVVIKFIDVRAEKFCVEKWKNDIRRSSELKRC